VALKSFSFGVVKLGTRVRRDDVGRFYIRVSTCVGAVTRGVVVCRCSGRFVGESRIGTGVGSDVSNTARVGFCLKDCLEIKVCSAVA
jgi:hypothetical protein